MGLSCISLNVRGLRDKKKRTLFLFLKEKQYDIIFIQETHCGTDEDLQQWSKEWEGPAFWSKGDTNSKGTAVLLRKGSNIDVKKSLADLNGRYVIIDAEIDDELYILCNIYAPNKGDERKLFFDQILDILRTNKIKDSLILGGDFNCTLNPQIDRAKNTVRNDPGIVELKRIINTFNLEDVWRRRNPNKRSYTYVGRAYSRIDMWLISQTLGCIIEKCDMIVNPLTLKDHKGITLRLNLSQVKRGPGVWKMNEKVVKSDLFTETFEQFWASWVKEKNKFRDIKEWWEMAKIKIKEITIWAATKLNKNKKNIEELEKDLAEATTDEDKAKIHQEIKEYYETKAEAARIRAREQWHEEGERSTAYFFSLEKRRAASKSWKKIKTAENKYSSSIDTILKTQVDFYENLYKSEGINEVSADELLTSIDKKLNEDDCALLENKITENELKKCVNQMSEGKSPGEDGITTSFYKRFWNSIGEEFTELVNFIHESQSLCTSQKMGLITLLYKQGEREDISNWRPITLLNTDYKIIAKCLAERLKTVLPKLIDEDQKGFVQGRSIESGVRLIQDTIIYTEEKNEGGAVIFLDQKKAFDRVEPAWVKKVLSKFGFGANFRKWMDILYGDIKSSILTNGFMSRSFKITRSVRQGCPIAPYIYVLQAEPFAEAIRKDNNIKGILLPKNKEVKLNMWADDAQTFLSTHNSFFHFFNKLQLYENSSGSRVNYVKTKGVLLGTWRTKPPPTNKISWVDNVKALGIYHGYNIDEGKIWEQKFEKIKRNLQNWQKRDLTFSGKVLLLKTFGLSVINYELRMKGINNRYIKELKTIFHEFLWDKKHPLVNRETISLPTSEGGLQMIDLENCLRISQIKLVNSIINGTEEKWTILPRHWFKQACPKINDELFVTKCSDAKEINLIKIPTFYREALLTWIELRKQRTIINTEEIRNENLFCNENIKIRNKTLLFAHWENSGLRKIKHVWDYENNTWVAENVIRQRLIIKNNWMMEYLSLKNAIPKIWKNTLKARLEQLKKTVKPLCITESGDIQIRNRPLTKAGNKHLLYVLQMGHTRPKCLAYWNKKYGKNLQWEKIWENLKLSKCRNKIKEFQWKSIHNVLNTNARLMLMKKGNGICPMCQAEEENQIHLFLRCPKIQPLVEIIQIEIKKKNTNYKLNDENIIFGWDENFTKKENFFLSGIIMNFKWEVWKNRNNKIFSNYTLTTENMFQKLKNSLL